MPRPFARSLAVAAVAVLGVSACTSDPSAQRVAEDLVRTEAAGFPEIEECMLDVVADYDLNDLGDAANSGDAEASTAANAELDEFQADLEACDPERVTSISERE
jgi:hypothetical protein